MKNMKRLQPNEVAILVILLATLLGGWLRFSPAITARFVVNDGGMFATMISDLQKNEYKLPAYTSYNQSEIPYVYPPLGLYFAAILNDIVNLDVLFLLKWLPAIISTLTIPAFAFLANSILLDARLKVAVATLSFAVLPRAYSWFVMGGGLTRSLGLLFFALSLAFILRLLRTGYRLNLFLSVLCSAGVILSHPEYALHTAGSAVFFWAMRSGKRGTLLLGGWVALGAALLSSPWWFTVLRQHGIEPLLQAGQTGSHGIPGLLLFLSLDFGQEQFATIITVFGLAGIWLQLGKRDYLLPLWLILPFLVEPRSSAAIAIFPLALLASIMLVDVVWPILAERKVEKSFLIVVLTYLAIGGYFRSSKIGMASLTDQQRNAMRWVEKHTAEESRFVLVTGDIFALCDPVQEWFPFLANRKSLTTLQGMEWTNGANFWGKVKAMENAQACFWQDETCLTKSLSDAQIKQYQYILVSKSATQNACGAEIMNVQHVTPLSKALFHNKNFEMVYENDEVIILSHHPQ